MFNDFFQIGPIPSNALEGFYDIRLVVLSYLVATFASYIALDITSRLRDVNNTKLSISLWLLGGSFAMGAGIWSMHYIGMLAFSIPNMPVTYEIFWTSISLLVAVFASGFALFLLKKQIIQVPRLALGGVILGLAIASMHYVGMEAMKIDMDIHYIPNIFILSIIVAIVASEAAIWLAIKSSQAVANIRVRLKVISAFIMGAAITGMHYTGMAAAIITPLKMTMVHSSNINPDILAMSIAGVTFLILGVAFLASTYKEALNQKLLLKARQAGMAEVAASVLHNVGNVLNSIGVSAALLNEKINNLRFDTISNLSYLIDQNKDNLEGFLTTHPKGKNVPEYIRTLATYWTEEKKLIDIEVGNLLKNIQHVKNIIAMQQEFSRTVPMEQIVSINDLVDETLLITGLQDNYNGINLIKNYSELRPVTVDKIKLLQILVNLFRNAKDALLASKQTSKMITITTKLENNNTFIIRVADNGVGIQPENKNSIFSYGFTTKKTGHGFGLHSCAIAAHEMGGRIAMESAGVEKGATFQIELPYRIHNVNQETEVTH